MQFAVNVFEFVFNSSVERSLIFGSGPLQSLPVSGWAHGLQRFEGNRREDQADS